ncbi:MAG: manganese catalase family protein [Acholeplasmatales bacterium]|nr:manganese catalase family protein [Acholeplasmatales bacterium]
MWNYNRYLMYPVQISKPNLDYAKYLVTAIGSYAGELGAALRYLNQVDTMPTIEAKALLTDIGTEEMGHVEILANMIKALTRGVPVEEIKKSENLANYVDHGAPHITIDTSGNPFTVTYYASSGDFITDLYEDLAAEQKARAMYEHLMDITDDPEILAPLSFLRQREIIHFNRFKELLSKLKKEIDK